MIPNQEQITAEVMTLQAIKPRVLDVNFFGESNRDAIAKQIEVLEDPDSFSEDEIERLALEEEWQSNVRDAALAARQWLDGESETDKPSAEWQSLER